jgi:putative addiction module component (TIGR02574 family)
MSKVSVADALELSISERIPLVEDIWDSIATVPQSVSLTPAQREELDRRLEDYRQHPGEGSPWEEVRIRILSEGVVDGSGPGNYLFGRCPRRN